MKSNITLFWNVAGGLTSIINSYILYKNGTSIQAGQWEYNSQIQLPILNAVFGNSDYTCGLVMELQPNNLQPFYM